MASLEERIESHLNLTSQFLWTRHSSPCLYRVGKEWGRGGGWRRTVWEDVIQAWLMTCASEPDESRTFTSFSAFSVFSKSLSLKEGVCECSAGGCLRVFSKRVFLSVQQEGVSECSARGCFWVFSKRVFLSVQQEGVSECSARGCFKCFWVFSKRVFLSLQQEGVSNVSECSARGCF